MVALFVFWIDHVISLILILFAFREESGTALMVTLIVLGLIFLVLIGTEAAKRGRRWIVWSLLSSRNRSQQSPLSHGPP